ncbi:unnamed protein product [Mytilus coruscus]|uniref:Helitron helicase-like domain-containing protein n=1 Tax=Mytilus coruscus TaxID=42192 RepID=A0A6J8C336_MYTCO|nr:unnamed protein product [Mytilus coruscus]
MSSIFQGYITKHMFLGGGKKNNNSKRKLPIEEQHHSKKFKASLPENSLLKPALISSAIRCSNLISCLYPKGVCSVCGKILYPDDLVWIKKEDMRFITFVTTTLTSIQTLEKEGKISVCKQCCNLTRSSSTEFNFFNNFSDIPQCIRALRNYADYRKLSIGTLFCSTFKPPGYTYTHLQGKLSFGIVDTQREGMLGILNETVEINSSISVFKPALQWLKVHNYLYGAYLSNYEKISGHFQPKDIQSSFPGIPFKTDNVVLETKGSISQEALDKSKGLIIPADNIIKPNQQSDYYILGNSISREVHSTTVLPANSQPDHLYSSDKNLEAKVFPHLFPDGSGSWSKQKNALTLGQYHKHRLLHSDRRWANDKLYLFYAFDRNMKERILNYPNIPTMSNANRTGNVTAKEVSKSKNSYDKYSKVLPATVTGSKAFWRKKWLDLVAMVRHVGPADLFVTLTANDSWIELKTILSQYDNPQSILHPVDTTEYFFKRFNSIKPLLFGSLSVFGKVKDHWYRIEAQNRGALHVHCLIWLESKIESEQLISAQIPTQTDIFSKQLATMVRDYQIHNCRPNRCFRSTKGLATKQCKYGFPYKQRETDGYDEEGMRYEYKRTSINDTRVVPYNPYILYAWDAHINVQQVTRSGLERYLVKYIAKVEPTFGLIVKDNPVQNYFESRLVGAPEAVASILSHHFVSGTRQVIFVDTNLPSERSRVLKSFSSLKESTDTDTDIYIEGPREFYMERPKDDLFTNLTFPRYVTDFEIFTSKTKIPKSRLNCLHLDLKGKFIVQRNTKLIPRFRFLTPLDGESFYFQTLLSQVPHRKEEDLISEFNMSKSYKEECYIQTLFETDDALDIVFREMKERNFDAHKIGRMARKLLIEQVSDEKTLKKKFKG